MIVVVVDACSKQVRDAAASSPISVAPRYDLDHFLHAVAKKMFTLLDLCVSSLRRGHANFSVSFQC